MTPAPVTVGIPTYARGARVVETLRRVAACTPAPAEVIVHVDRSDGQLEHVLRSEFPAVRLISSTRRVGPGGGRHRCVMAASQPWFVSFDDDSWPVDADFFAEVERLFSLHPRVAVLAAAIYHPHESAPDREDRVMPALDYTGCGYALRVDAYRALSGHVDRPNAYGIEEVDLALQLHAADWQIVASRSLRVFHDSRGSHHSRAEIVASTVQNAALLAYLRYPPPLWPRALLQVLNVIWFMGRSRRFAGLGTGIWGIPSTLRAYQGQRRRLPADKVRSYLNGRRARRTA